jgi:hypothetical protein
MKLRCVGNINSNYERSTINGDDQTKLLPEEIYNQLFQSFTKQYNERIDKLEKRINHLEQELLC